MKQLLNLSFVILLTSFCSTTLLAGGWDIFDSSTAGFTNNNITSIAEVPGTGDIWLGSGGGLAFYDKSADSWTLYNINNSGLPANFVLSVAVAPNGDLWAGTANDGLVQFDGTSWTTYTIANSGLPYNTVKDVIFDNDGDLWAATALGIAEYDGTTWTTYSTSNGLPSNAVNALEVDADNQVWVGMEPNGNFPGGLAKLDNGIMTKYTTADGLSDNWVYDLDVDPQGNLWIATRGGLCKFDRNITFTTYDTSNSNIPTNDLSCVATGSGGNTCVGTQSSGMVEFDGQTTWTRYTTGNSGLPNNKIQAMFVASDGQTKWVATQQGGAARFSLVLLGIGPSLSDLGVRVKMANPVSVNDRMVLEVDEPLELRISVLDMAGRVVFEMPAAVYQPGNHEVRFAFSGAAGVYSLRVVSGGAAYVRKVWVK